ncbi:hypothetical protein BpHYR1_052484 [Brachionus plicatilis]|uniref:Uncharacterized protein n=1 Tax=Brachionus plicatilis TaxID=10195 RepID=A0A3M7TAS5_BRAPC|nr:hypothetical protein BpHYR1_052484 [Brachionus plicatilis]
MYNKLHFARSSACMTNTHTIRLCGFQILLNEIFFLLLNEIVFFHFPIFSLIFIIKLLALYFKKSRVETSLHDLSKKSRVSNQSNSLTAATNVVQAECSDHVTILQYKAGFESRYIEYPTPLRKDPQIFSNTRINEFQIYF